MMTVLTHSKTEFDLAQFARLKVRLSGDCKVIVPGDEAYDMARRGWNLAVDQYPVMIVVVKTVEDVSETIRFAQSQGLNIAITATGHGVIRKADNSLLIDTSKMAAVSVNSAARTAWVGAGTKWGAVLEAAQAVGLAPLLGSSPDVGAIGYTLGGGMGWLVRKYGLSADSVNYFDVVTVDGEQIRASATEHVDLFWALRGGGGNFGVVTGMEIKLYPVNTVYGGNLFYPIQSVKEVFARYREWIANVPDELTSSIVIMNFPPFPAVPEFLRGKSFVMIRGCYSGPIEEGEALLRYWREWKKPIIDDFKAMPFSQVATISNDPLDPIPSFTSGAWLKDLSDEVADTLTQYTVPRNGPPMLMFIEVRHAGGAIAAVDPHSAAYGNREALFNFLAVAAVPTPQIHTGVSQYITQLKLDLTPHLHGGVYINFLEGDEARKFIRKGFSTDAFTRLQIVKAKYDPQNIFNHSYDFQPGQSQDNITG
jgi:hypothetical protein